MEKKFTRAMVCEEFKSTCGKCPLHSSNNPKSLPCWLLNESDIQDIMKDYPYVDVKVRMIFNDIETRLTAVEEKVSESKLEPIFDVEKMRVLGDEIGIISGSYVDEKLYDKLEAKHEADCRLISEYDIENKKLEDEISVLNKQIDSFSLTCRLYEKETKDLKSDVERWVERYDRLRDMDKKRLFDSKNAENERDHYKGLYLSKCDDYDRLLEKQIKAENERDEWMDRAISAEKVCNEYKISDWKKQFENKELKNCLNELEGVLCKNALVINGLKHEIDLLRESNNNHGEDNVELEGENDALSTRNAFLEDKIEEQKSRITSLESKLRNQRANLTSLQEKHEDAVKMNKAREDVYYANIKLQKTIDAKDREIGLLRAELDKYKTDECDDRWID